MKISILFFVLVLFSNASIAMSGKHEATHDSSNGNMVEDVCSYVSELYEADKLESILLVPGPNELKDNTFSIDFDNDGVEEELKYHIGGNRFFLGEILKNGEPSIFSDISSPNAFANGINIINVNDDFFVFYSEYYPEEYEQHTGKYWNPYEIQRLEDTGSEEELKDGSFIWRPSYKTELVCKFY